MSILVLMACNWHICASACGNGSVASLGLGADFLAGLQFKKHRSVGRQELFCIILKIFLKNPKVPCDGAVTGT
jgi:hypothetical protein